MSLSNDSTVMTMPVAPVYQGNNGGFGNGWGGNGSMWGGDWSAWIILFLIWGAFSGGWGNGFGGGANGVNGPGFQSWATRADINEGFALNNLQNGQTSIKDAVTNGFHGVDTAVCQLGYNTQQGFNNLASQLASCCCETQSAIQGTRYDIATSAAATQNTIQNATRDLMENSNANSRAILQALSDNYVRTLERENSDLRMNALISNSNAVNQAARDAQTAELLRRTGHDCPTAAYVVQPPTPVTFPNYCNPCGTCA